MSGKSKTQQGPKPWARRVAMRQSEKQRVRTYWTRARWTKYVARREGLRHRPHMPHLKSSRMARKRELAANAARRERMLAYHARRRAALADVAELRRPVLPAHAMLAPDDGTRQSLTLRPVSRS